MFGRASSARLPVPQATPIVAGSVDPPMKMRPGSKKIGARWTDAWSGEEHEGGQTIVAEAPIERIPLFLRDGAALPVKESR